MPDDAVFQSSTLATPPAGLRVSGEEVTTLNAGAVTAQLVQRVAIASRTADGTAVDLIGTTADGLLVNLGTNNDVTVTGTVTVQDGGNVISVDDGAGSLTIDGTVTANLAAGTNNIGDVDVLTVPAPLNLTGGGVEASALRVTIANDSTGVVSVDDNGATLSIDDGAGSITVDGTVAVSGTVAVDSELTTADLDTGAGTDTRAVVGLALAASGGALLVGSANPMPVSDNGSSLTVDGSVTVGAALPAGTNNIGDVDVASIAAGDNNIGNVDIVTVPAPLSTTGGGTEATALRVTVASDSTGVLSVDDNGAALTVDNAGTFAVQVDGAALTALQLIDDTVYAEDAAHVSADKGIMALAVRTDSPDNRSGTDGDYEPLQVSYGRQWVNAVDMLRISVQSGGLTTATTAYTGGDQLGTEFTLANAARAAGRGGYITGVILVSAADIIGPVDVVFTRESITLAGDNASWAISDADAVKIAGLVQLIGALDIGNNRICQAHNIKIPFDCVATSLFASIITRSDHTFFGAVTDLQLIVTVERN